MRRPHFGRNTKGSFTVLRRTHPVENTVFKLIEARHSVRSYTNEPVSDADVAVLREEIARCEEESGLHIKLVLDDPEPFNSALAHYGKFSNVRNYLVIAGPASADLNERCGYYGERLVLFAQEQGLNTCWVALTFKKRYVRKLLVPGDKLGVVIAIGYGTTQGKSRKSKTPGDVSSVPNGAERPDWFERGVEAALLAPTALNQQSFEIRLEEGASPEGKPLVSLISKGGFYSDIDLGIVRLHFELGAGPSCFEWK